MSRILSLIIFKSHWQPNLPSQRKSPPLLVLLNTDHEVLVTQTECRFKYDEKVKPHLTITHLLLLYFLPQKCLTDILNRRFTLSKLSLFHTIIINTILSSVFISVWFWSSRVKQIPSLVSIIFLVTRLLCVQHTLKSLLGTHRKVSRFSWLSIKTFCPSVTRYVSLRKSMKIR